MVLLNPAVKTCTLYVISVDKIEITFKKYYHRSKYSIKIRMMFFLLWGLGNLTNSRLD